MLYFLNIEHESMTLIMPMLIMQAKTTSRREQAEEETEEKRQREGTLYRNKPYV